jgi:hypothetical protein
MNAPEAALRLAEANWTVQREPADARILLDAAEASHAPRAAVPVLAWYRSSHIEDSAIAASIARLFPDGS